MDDQPTRTRIVIERKKSKLPPHMGRIKNNPTKYRISCFLGTLFALTQAAFGRMMVSMEQSRTLEDLVRSIASCGRQHIIIKGSPDPDALASAWALALVGEGIGVSWLMYIEQPLSLSQNRALVRALGLRLHSIEAVKKMARKGDGYSIVDHPDSTVGSIPDWLPCVVHIDHHTPVAGLPPARFRSIDPDSGATATIIGACIFSGGMALKEEKRRLLASALLAGILTDTDHMRLAGQNDRRVMGLLSQYADDRLVRRISLPAMSAEILHEQEEAERHAVVYKGWMISGIGYIESSTRDTIAIVADRLLDTHREVEAVVVFAGIEDSSRGTLVLDASMRCRDADLDLERIIKSITHHGGARKHKGAFQIPLEFLRYCSDRKQLWSVLEDATVHALMMACDKHGKKGILATILAPLRRFFGRWKK